MLWTILIVCLTILMGMTLYFEYKEKMEKIKSNNKIEDISNKIKEEK